ncbi:MAG: thiamine phosphate synthase [Gammaproteobacteria bacterium]|nr:thiamine phosphate synthase [Gammaproteobacteria bacterium]
MSDIQNSFRGLYAITPTSINNTERLLYQVEQAILGGAALIQYRNKDNNPRHKEKEARALLDLCHQHHRLLIINDDVALARTINADGVHIGSDDMGIIQARQQLGDHAIIGVSCYNNLELALQVADQGASYVAFGRFFPSRSKPDATLADIETLRQARQQIDLPIIAIGGITADNGKTLIDAGADMLAVIQGIFGKQDIRIAAEEINRLF